jgi:hypothetical protein
LLINDSFFAQQCLADCHHLLDYLALSCLAIIQSGLRVQRKRGATERPALVGIGEVLS